MPTLAQIRATIDADLAALWPQIVSRQATYFANNGRYWQGVVTHSVLPADGNSTPADRLALKPSYQAEDWLAGINVATFTKPYALEIHQYNGPNGPGFVAFCRVTVLGNTYLRAQDSGAEPYRTQPWTQVA